MSDGPPPPLPRPDGLAGVELLRIRLPFRRPFATSQWTSAEKDAVLVRAFADDGAEGWGECVAAEAPWYSSEWTGGAWLALCVAAWSWWRARTTARGKRPRERVTILDLRASP